MNRLITVLAAILLIANTTLSSADTRLTSAARSAAQVRLFKVQSGYPNGRPGFVVDHILPLCAGGPDLASNMQWQAKAASYQKDIFERALCKALKSEGYVLTKRPATPAVSKNRATK